MGLYCHDHTRSDCRNHILNRRQPAHEFKLPFSGDAQERIRALTAFVLLFDLYTLYQHLQLHRVRRELAHRDRLFQRISEDAVDRIAVVDKDGSRLYNSPAYEKILGYSPNN